MQRMRRVNNINEGTDKDLSDDNEEQFVLQIDRNGRNPYYAEGTMCGNHFKALIDTGSQVSVFTKRSFQRITGERKLVIRDLIDNEHSVGYNERQKSAAIG